MTIKFSEKQYRVDILPYAEAPWAPRAPGTALRWAWRIVDGVGDPQMCGSSNLPEDELRQLTEAAVIRLKKYETGKPPKVNPTLKRKGSVRATVELSAE